MTPFSGLSLIVHLLIVVGTAVFSFLFPKGEQDVVPRQDRVPQTSMVYFSKSALSILLILGISTFVVVSFISTLRMGIREGAQEAHMQYLQREFAQLREIRPDSLTYLAAVLLTDVQDMIYMAAEANTFTLKDNLE